MLRPYQLAHIILESASVISSILAQLTSATAPRQPGQGMVEYGLIIALVAVVAIAGLIILGPQVGSLFSGLGSSV